MSIKGTLLIVDDNRNVVNSVKLLICREVDNVITASLPDCIPELIRKHHPQVILLDMNFRASVNTGNEGLYWLREIQRISPNTAVILFTAYADVALAVEGMKLGAADFIVKPFDNSVLVSSIKKAFGDKKAPKSKTQSKMIWGNTQAMKELKNIVERVAVTDANILIIGENGTGKDLLAREIHNLSLRSSGPLEIVDMGAIIESLFESELYGSVKSAYTDAKTDRAGKFETAHGGSLFLDEIGNLPYHLQAKLLTSIQQKQVIRVGSNTPRPIDIRLICATNSNLTQMVDEGKFRQDLFYRINTITLKLPSLRERADDIPEFVDLFLEKYAKAYAKEKPNVTDDDIRRLSALHWPGNIRQLEHVVEKALIMNDNKTLCFEDFDVYENSLSTTKESSGTLEEMEKNAIIIAIRQHSGNMTEVARQLGITRQTLYNKIKKYEI